MRLKVEIVALLACASCDGGESAPRKRVTIEIAGGAQCLGSMTGALDLPAATMPVWTNHLGRIELGPFGAAELPGVINRLQAMKCVQAIRQRPCATPLTDIDRCSAPSRHR